MNYHYHHFKLEEKTKNSASPRPLVIMSADNSCHFKYQNGTLCSNKVNKGDRLCPTHKLVPEQLKMRLGLSPTKSSGKTVHTGSRLVSTLAEIKSEPVEFGELGPGYLDHTPLVKDPSHPVISTVKSEPMDMEDHRVQNQFGPTPLFPEPSCPPPNDSFHLNMSEASMLTKAENIIATSDFNNTMESNIHSDKPLPSGKIPSAPSPPEPVKVSEKTPDPIGMSSSEPPPPPPSPPPILSDQSNDSVGPLATSEDLLRLVVPPSSPPLASVDAKETLSNSSTLSPNPPHPSCPDHANLNNLTKSPPIDRADLNPPQSPEEPMETSSQAGGGVPSLPDIEFVGVTSQPRESVSLSPDIKSITPASLKIELAELNRREEEVQIALVETESELSQVTGEVEELQKKLSLLTASKERLVEKCNELTRQYQEVLSLKQNLLFSKYVSKYIPQLTKKTYVHSPVSSTSCKSLTAIPSSKQQSDSPSPQVYSCSESPQPLCLDELVPETFSSSSGTKKHSLKAESFESKKFKTEPEDDFNNGNETDRLGTEGVLSNQAIPNSESKNKSFRNRNESTSTEARSIAALHSQSEEVFFQPQQEEMRTDQSLECTRVIPEFRPFSNSVLSMKIHGQTLFACSSDKTTRAYDVKTGKILKQFSNHQKAVKCLELYHGEEGTFLLSSSSDKLIHMYNIESGKIVAKFKCITRVMGVFDSLLYIAQPSGSIAIIDLQRKQLIGKQRCHSSEKAISSITVTSSMLFTAAFDHTVFCWDIKELNQSHQMTDELNIVKKISTFNDMVLCMAIHDYSLLCGSADKSVQVFDTHTWERTHCLKCHNGAVTALEIMGKVLVTACFDKMIRCFDLESFELLQVYAGHSDMIFSLVTSNGIIYAGSRDGSLKGIHLDLTVYYECKWPNCKLRFGMFQHLKQHIKVHCPDNEGPSKCLWEACVAPDSFTDLLQHVQNTHLANESDFRL